MMMMMMMTNMMITMVCRINSNRQNPKWCVGILSGSSSSLFIHHYLSPWGEGGREGFWLFLTFFLNFSTFPPFFSLHFYNLFTTFSQRFQWAQLFSSFFLLQFFSFVKLFPTTSNNLSNQDKNILITIKIIIIVISNCCDEKGYLQISTKHRGIPDPPPPESDSLHAKVKLLIFISLIWIHFLLWFYLGPQRILSFLLFTMVCASSNVS